MMELFTALRPCGRLDCRCALKATEAGQMGVLDPVRGKKSDVRALLNHVIGTLWLAAGLLADQAPRYPMAPGGLPPADLAGGDPAAAYAEAAAAALAAAAAGDALTRVHVTPLGEMPGPALAGFTTLDILVHGWDLARATGQPSGPGRPPRRARSRVRRSRPFRRAPARRGSARPWPPPRTPR